MHLKGFLVHQYFPDFGGKVLPSERLLDEVYPPLVITLMPVRH